MAQLTAFGTEARIRAAQQPERYGRWRSQPAELYPRRSLSTRNALIVEDRSYRSQNRSGGDLQLRRQPPLSSNLATSPQLTTSTPAPQYSRTRTEYPPRTSSLRARQHGALNQQLIAAVPITSPPQPRPNHRVSTRLRTLTPPLNSTNRPPQFLRLRLSPPEQPAQGNESVPFPEIRECIACLEAHFADDFPPMTITCKHLPTLCTSCVQEAFTATALELATINRVRCTHQSCTEALSHDDIRRLATPQVFERYDYLVTRAALGDLENFMHCPNPRCNGGQEHIGGLGELFVCIDCGHRFCTRHNVNWHEGETCLQYENRINLPNQNPERPSVQRGEDKETRDLLARISKPCPRCRRPIQKTAGCDHMKCVCGHQFCWLCLGNWSRGHVEGCPINPYAHLLL